MECILYSAFLPVLGDEKHHNQQIFSQLYYSLETLKNTGYSDNIFLLYDSDVKIENFFFKGKYNLEDFKNLTCVNFSYDENIKNKTKCAFHKWDALKVFSKRVKFNRVLCVDNDTIFNFNPRIIFEENTDLNSFYGKQYYFKDDIIKEKLKLKAQCLNTGQFMVSKEVMNILGENFLDDVLENYFLTLKITNQFKKELSGHMVWVGEEYAMTKTLEDKKIPIINLSDKYAIYSRKDEKSVLCHYYSGNTKKVVPKKYWSKYTSDRDFTGYSHLSIVKNKERIIPNLKFYKTK